MNRRSIVYRDCDCSSRNCLLTAGHLQSWRDHLIVYSPDVAETVRGGLSECLLPFVWKRTTTLSLKCPS
jgi:hypothetical protein